MRSDSTWPAARCTMRSASHSASRRSWVTYTAVVPIWRSNCAISWHRFAQCAVEIGERLIKQQHAGFGDNGARQRDALLLRRTTLRVYARQMPPARLFPVPALRVAHALRAEHCASSTERRRFAPRSYVATGRNPERPCQCRALQAVTTSQLLPPIAKPDLAARGFSQPGQQSQQRAFAAAGRPKQRNNATGLNMQVDVIENGVCAERVGRHL